MPVSLFSEDGVKELGGGRRGHREWRRGPGTLNPIFLLLEEQMFELCFLAQQLIVIQMHVILVGYAYECVFCVLPYRNAACIRI